MAASASGIPLYAPTHPLTKASAPLKGRPHTSHKTHTSHPSHQTRHKSPRDLHSYHSECSSRAVVSTRRYPA